MSSFKGLRLPPISDDRRFEKFISDLWGLRYGVRSQTLYGRSGQAQHGVDVLLRAGDQLIGIQCKAVGSLTSTDLDREVKRALGFTPPLTQFVMTTTSPHDARLVSHAAQVTGEHLVIGQSEVSYFGWDDLMRMLEDFPRLIPKYFPDFVAPVEQQGAGEAPVTNAASVGGPAPLVSNIQDARMPTTTGDKLFGRGVELQLLDRTWRDGKVNILTFIGMGGTGKTALINRWLDDMQNHGWRGAEKVYTWSFYSQGMADDRQASADPFFDHALRWFGYDGAQITSAWERGLKLAELVAAKRSLLVLDGLEPLQYPPGEMHGRLRDQGMQALLRQLSRTNRGLCVITTRAAVVELATKNAGAVTSFELKNLEVEDGAALLRHLGVIGAEKHLRDAVEDFDGHALALTLLGTYIVAVHGGDIIAGFGESDLQASVPGLGGHAERVMATYERWLGGSNKVELAILYLVGLFDRPAPSGAVDALRAHLAISELAGPGANVRGDEWKFALQHLRTLHLLNPPDEVDHGGLDAHPLVREFFGRRLKASSPGFWRLAHERLYEYYKNLPKRYLPETVGEMEPLILAVAHGCKAGKIQEAFDDVYWTRVKRKDLHFNLHDLGMFGDDLYVLRHYFDSPWTEISHSLRPYNRAEIANWAGYCFQALGSLREAAPLMDKSYTLFVELGKHWEAALVASILSGIYLALGDINRALESAHRSVDHAAACEDDTSRPDRNYSPATFFTVVADTLHQAGDLAGAGENFRSSIEKQSTLDPRMPLHGLSGYRYWEFCLSSGRLARAFDEAARVLDDAERLGLSVLGKALCNLAMGAAAHLRAKEHPDSADADGMEYLDEACFLLRKASVMDHLPRGYLERAKVLAATGRLDESHKDLCEAFDVARRGRMLLHIADCHLISARLALASGRPDDVVVLEESDDAPRTADRHLARASELIGKTGYGRRNPDVALVRARLSIARAEWGEAQRHLGIAERYVDGGWEIHAFEARELAGAVRQGGGDES